MKQSRRGRGGVTIDDVARHAGVSAMTVSRVINGENNVRDATRDRVKEAIEKLSFRPNTAARNLAAGKDAHIALLYSNPSNAYFSEILVGALDGARRGGHHLIIETCDLSSKQEQEDAVRRAINARALGVVIPPPVSESKIVLSALAKAEIPSVTIVMGEHYKNPLNVRMDDRAAGQEMVGHLIGLGHRRIGMILGDPNQLASKLRYQGYVDALNAAGIAIDETLVEQGYFEYKSGHIAAEKLLNRADRPTAIFASNDDMAAATISVAHRSGLDVPGDLSVAGFDDTALATNVWPELTTIRQPICEMAEAAVALLLANINSPVRHPVERVLDYRLVVRQSTAPPR
ncbi:LacI family DNA-binding transcriptional regulator [Sphingomonas sabuli]|uniref:LacI family DNA-binding transcriptional regulator n=1 Tax=Sphingomonas sabuli TaxID=2764186 RepID=A0A7G9KZR1_9SPHN|nr:LacI family DNA-binding transcriptional regulator [Sphingomonas sabuli]QNM81860.1 LacI family DNA-binding transcriptional regulator [Sphingomonas sabuli]